MESGIDAPLPSSSNVVGHEISVSENVNEPVVKPLSLLSPSAMSSSSLLTVSSPALTDSVCGGSLSLVSMPSASSVLLNTTTGMSQVQTIGSDIASSPSAVFSGVDPSRTLENSEGQGEGFMVSPVVDTGLDSTQSPQLQSVRTRSVDTDITENTQSESSHQETVFVPTLGAWAKPLLFKPPATPTTPSTPTDNELAKVGNQLAALWPTLNDAILNKKPKTKQPTRTLMPPVEKLPLPELKPDGSLRFPWAARLSPQSRNLYRAASPTYRLDGTPEISIPSKVLKLGPENKDEYIIGKFHKCSLPPGGLIHAVVNRIWGRSCKISCKKIGESSYMFHIPHEPTRHWVIQRGVWHIDDCLLFVLPWTPEGSFKIPEISTLPVWVNLKQIPDCCYSRLGISHIASGLGEPILTHKPRLDPTSMGEAKVLVEMELDRDFPKIIALDDKQGNIFLVEVEYTWIPSMCERCGNLGHKEKRCLLPSKPADEQNLPQHPIVVSNEVPVVDIDHILKSKHSEDSIGADPTATIQDPIDTAHDSTLNPTASPEVCTSNLKTTTLSFSSPSQLEKPASPLTSATPPDTLVDSQSTPTATPIMDCYPSKITNNEVIESLVVDLMTTTPIHCAFESSSRFSVLGNVDEAEIEPPNSISLTRGGRESKPPIKYQSMEWKTVQGRGKRGRGGRGSSH
ncbi:unnamed protein product [Brassica rapa]|uniref:CCHC-type domain-containing protein n=4 Tax=Brassica TaxID=3705 RepID=A0A8D9DA32_BRACM|nr:unnamed protein product [Brassica napus]CAG7869618.1 unnamed protein product [Brassica rapa]